jgi:uncharacterized protein YecE (DUF72 family)
MSTRWHIGAKELRGAIAAYAKRFDLLEVRVAPHGSGSEAAIVPTIATLRRWRKSVPPAFDFSVVAGPNLARVKAGPALEVELEAAHAAVDALQARCFVLRTPADVTPAALWRERIAKVVERFPRDATHFVWEPSGVWEAEAAAAQAREWGIVVAVDPTREPVPEGAVAYLHLRALGETRSFGPTALEKVVRGVGAGRRDVFAILETDSAMVEAKRLRSLVKVSRTAARGGLGRLVRPRGGGIVVRDDEQE